MHRLYSLTLAALLSACGQNAEPPESADTRTYPDNPAPSAGPAVPPGQPPSSASAQLAPTQGNEANGSLVVTSAPAGVRISGALQGLKPDSELGFHIHENGDCSALDASSAGEHFNPENKPHGHPESAARHAGDMVNVKSDAEGIAEVDTTVKGVSVHEGGAADVLGKSIVLHAKPDDFKTQPSGDSGDRIACGVITFEAQNAPSGSTSP